MTLPSLIISARLCENKADILHLAGVRHMMHMKREKPWFPISQTCEKRCSLITENQYSLNFLLNVVYKCDEKTIN